MKTKISRVYPIAIIGVLLTFTFSCEIDDPEVFTIKFAGGTGTWYDPYLIATPKQLNGVRHNLNRHFKQIADIDLSGYSSGEGWQPIGDNRKAFSGTFDGNGYKITNLSINRPEKERVGLFENTDKSTIRNTVLEIYKMTGRNSVGGLVGFNRGDIINCNVTGDVSATSEKGGGLVGENWGGNIKNSYAVVSVSGGGSVGGLVGSNNGGSISESYATGDVSGGLYVGGLVGGNHGYIGNSYARGNISGKIGAGGLVGRNYRSITNSYATGDISGINNGTGGLVGYNSGDITNSYAEGSVSGFYYVGGFVGLNQEGGDIINSYAKGNVIGNRNDTGGFLGKSSGNIKNCYAIGNVRGKNNTGGLVGNYIGGDIEYSYYDKETTGQDDIYKGIPKTTAEMMRQSTFETWDFTFIWCINEGNRYPYLHWQE